MFALHPALPHAIKLTDRFYTHGPVTCSSRGSHVCSLTHNRPFTTRPVVRAFYLFQVNTYSHISPFVQFDVRQVCMFFSVVSSSVSNLHLILFNRIIITFRLVSSSYVSLHCQQRTGVSRSQRTRSKSSANHRRPGVSLANQQRRGGHGAAAWNRT